MDRFESCKFKFSDCNDTDIYIPIWIDLKADQEVREAVADFFIYIPIWIDLKACSAIIPMMTLLHLHSNMDRFERNL